MIDIAKRAVQLWRTDGFLSLVNSTKHFLRNKRTAVERWWTLRVTKQHSTAVGNVSATFLVQSSSDLAHFSTTVEAERPVYEDLLDCLRAGDVFYDIGANEGVYSCLAGFAISEGTVVAFEPFPANARRIERNFAYNDFPATLDTHVFEHALSDEGGTTDLVIGIDKPGAGVNGLHASEKTETVYKELWGGTDTIPVAVSTGDEFVSSRNIPRPTVLKIDVEGAELNVIDGFEEIIRDSVRLLYVEVHPPALLEPYGHRQADINARLEEFGFTVDRIHEEGVSYYLRCEK